MSFQSSFRFSESKRVKQSAIFTRSPSIASSFSTVKTSLIKYFQSTNGAKSFKSPRIVFFSIFRVAISQSHFPNNSLSSKLSRIMSSEQFSVTKRQSQGKYLFARTNSVFSFCVSVFQN